MKDNYAFVIFKEDIAKDAAEKLDHHEIDGMYHRGYNHYLSSSSYFFFFF